MVIFISGWTLYCIAVAILLITALPIQYYGAFFTTRDVLVRDFNILDLQLASTEMEIDNTLKGITQLPPAASAKVIRALKNQLYIDFLLMPAVYGTIFISCMKVAWKMPEPGMIFFSLLGWLQIVAWICDIMENCYLLGKTGRLNKEYKPSYMRFRGYQVIEVLKWGLSMLATVCVLSALLYFWISGLYMEQSLKYLLMIVLMLIVFFVLIKFLAKPGIAWKRSLGN